MNMSTAERRKKAVSNAKWSVKAEGLRPNKVANKNLHSYATGKISASQLRKNTTNHVQFLARSAE